MFKKSSKCGKFVVVRCKSQGVKMAESFVENTISRFRFPKTGEEESKLLQWSIPRSTAYKTKN